jgi:hypothetical protein
VYPNSRVIRVSELAVDDGRVIFDSKVAEKVLANKGGVSGVGGATGANFAGRKVDRLAALSGRTVFSV